MRRLCLLLIVTLGAGCGRSVDPPLAPDAPGPISTDFGRLGSVLEGVRKDREVVVYEGLPSEFWEPQFREQEARSKKTTRLHGYAFYDAPQPVLGADAERLAGLFLSRSSFKRYRSQKVCGGYHPDFCIEWKSESSTTHALICLECGEVKFFGPSSELHCDLLPEVGERLTQWLAPYQKSRPAEGARG